MITHTHQKPSESSGSMGASVLPLFWNSTIQKLNCHVESSQNRADKKQMSMRFVAFGTCLYMSVLFSRKTGLQTCCLDPNTFDAEDVRLELWLPARAAVLTMSASISSSPHFSRT
eukprot:6488986-Amphidinium_carterae.2